MTRNESFRKKYEVSSQQLKHVTNMKELGDWKKRHHKGGQTARQLENVRTQSQNSSIISKEDIER